MVKMRNPNIVTEEHHSSIVLGVEMIQKQNNDILVTELKDIFQTMISLKQNSKGINNIKGYLGLKGFKKCLLELDKVINARIFDNVKVSKHILDVNTGYSVSHAGLYGDNVFIPNMKEVVDWMKELTKGTDPDAQHIDDSFRANKTLMRKWSDGIHKLDSQLDTSSVLVDNETATISGLPNGFVVVFSMNPEVYLDKLNATAEELTAVLIHEIGHAYTSIANMYRSTRTTTQLVDSMIENTTKKGKGFKDSLIITYADALGGEPDDIKDSSIPVALVNVAQGYLKACNFKINRTDHSNSDFEQQADQFATRFGVGQDLSIILHKHNEAKIQNKRYISISTSMWIVFYGIIILILTGALFLSMFAMLYVGIVYIVIESIIINVGIIIDSNTGKYDNDHRRLVRIRNDMTRNLKDIKDKKHLEIALKSIDEVNAIIELTEIPTESWGTKLSNFVFTSDRERKELKNMEEIIEDLTSNSLNLAVARLKNTKE